MTLFFSFPFLDVRCSE